MMKETRRHILFPDVSDADWNDWRWQVRNRIETLEDLKKYVELTPDEEEGVKACLGTLRMAITPYYLSLSCTSPSPTCWIPSTRMRIPRPPA